MMRSLSPEQGDQGAGGQADRQLEGGGGVGHGELLLLAPDDGGDDSEDLKVGISAIWAEIDRLSFLAQYSSPKTIL